MVSIEINGSVQNLATTSGDVTVRGAVENLSTGSGDVTCETAGNVSTGSGDVHMQRGHLPLRMGTGKKTIGEPYLRMRLLFFKFSP